MFGIDWSERARVIFVGDDETDEDAMTALKGTPFAQIFESRTHIPFNNGPLDILYSMAFPPSQNQRKKWIRQLQLTVVHCHQI